MQLAPCPAFDRFNQLSSVCEVNAHQFYYIFLIKDIPGIAPEPAGAAKAEGWQQRTSPIRYVTEQRVLCPGVSGDGAAFVNELQRGAQHKVSIMFGEQMSSYTGYAHTFRLEITCPSVPQSHTLTHTYPDPIILFETESAPSCISDSFRIKDSRDERRPRGIRK